MTRLYCPACRVALTHKLLMLHAGADTLLVCHGAWESLPQWMSDGYEQAKGKPLEKRGEVVREIRENLEAEA